jgi:hypothetical protein
MGKEVGMTIRRSKPLKTALFATLLSPVLIPNLALAEDELCPKAFTWFSCQLDNGKTVAICGSPSISDAKPVFGADTEAWLQYRYGTSEYIELRYPDGRGRLLWQQFLAGIEYGADHAPIRINFGFINDGVRYLIQGNQAASGGDLDYALSVIDEAAIKTLAEYRCVASTYDPNLLAVASAVPCDPNDAGNDTRDQECR